MLAVRRLLARASAFAFAPPRKQLAASCGCLHGCLTISAELSASSETRSTVKLMSASNERRFGRALAVVWFELLGYAVGHGPHLAPGEPAAERDSFGEVVLVGRLREAIRRLNPAIPEEAREEALRKVLRVGTPSLTQTNRAFHRMLRDGVPVEYPRPDGSIAGDHVRLVDFGDVRANDWLAVNQFTVIEGQHNRRPDIVVFVNGLPLGLIELKNAADEDATIWSAYAQLQTYKAEIPSLLHYNAALVVCDGLQARIGSLTANQEWFKVWRTIDGEGDAPKTALELEVLVRGVFERQRFLDLLQHFIVFEEDPDTGALHKIIAGYHQFHAVNAAVEETVRASGDDRKPARAARTADLLERAGCTAASRATVARAWSGTRRAAARVSRCSSTPRAWCGIRRCRTRRWWC